jgi:DNA-binding MarR family transcriptional regulator
MSALAEAIFQVSATITGIVDRLEERELVERKRDQADRRVWRVFLTTAGKDLLLAVEHQRQASWMHIWAQFEPPDRQHMLRLMQRYLEMIQAANEQEA